ncbi:gamma carbonic anhydrase family protein [Venenivibrio stagnispumantis]|uniref:Carbonic anhydrase or acetyltransferase, isoleucine patch superfamily n=1 Tax=Venenivibrio stagnispumantis TaxID=407998 RepID=A0AA46ACR4_9AQUI|nr:gamma carbonic anhydrase family protein [Venenivibrio stagnispumantis]MCW4572603.1 gamma carbonic anhydrase family protein [Venenivibrio stagnispumantis]SMP00514.1 Carbonic anhydrase or acetyltransferase, isoleucine patch superfamily [Venenivibrio stagnispumantis]
MPIIKGYKGKYPKIDQTAFIAENAVIIGDVEIGKDASIWYNVVIRGDVNYIRIGDRTNIQDGTIIHVTHDTHPTIIGNEVTVGHNVMLHGCVIEDRVLIGMSATVMDGVIVGKESIVAAGALVPPNKKIEPHSLWAGVPAKFVRNLTEEEIKHLEKSYQNYIKYKNIYLENKDE